MGIQANRGEISQISKHSLNQTYSSKGGAAAAFSTLNHNSQISNSSGIAISNFNNNNVGSSNMILAGIKEEDDMNIENERQGGAIHIIHEDHPLHTSSFQNNKDFYEG